MAALELKHSVHVSLTRQQMFSFGHWSHTLQYLKVAAAEQGTLQSLQHAALAGTSQFEDFTEIVAN